MEKLGAQAELEMLSKEVESELRTFSRTRISKNEMAFNQATLNAQLVTTPLSFVGLISGEYRIGQNPYLDTHSLLWEIIKQEHRDSRLPLPNWMRSGIIFELQSTPGQSIAQLDVSLNFSKSLFEASSLIRNLGRNGFLVVDSSYKNLATLVGSGGPNSTT